MGLRSRVEVEVAEVRGVAASLEEVLQVLRRMEGQNAWVLARTNGLLATCGR